MGHKPRTAGRREWGAWAPGPVERGLWATSPESACLQAMIAATCHMVNVARVEPSAALALTEAVTRLSDRTDPVPDQIWEEAARYYDEQALAALVLWIAVVNVFNRVNVATRQVPGEWRG